MSFTLVRVKDLFVLSASSSYVSKMSTNDGASIWHARLGHLSMDKLKIMLSKILLNELLIFSSFGCGDVCEGCQYGKAHRLLFDKSFSRCQVPLECSHNDLMGHCATPSYSSSCYMLLFVHDFSRYIWVYFVKEKSEVFSKFLKCKETVERVLNLKLRADNDGEFTSHEFFSFYRKNGIKRELSCA